MSSFYQYEEITMENGMLVNLLAESMSPDHVTVIEKLSEPKRDEELAAELNVKETVVRTLLNDLHVKSLVEYERTKNKKTGWYTYLWKKREDKLNAYVQDYLEDKLGNLSKDLEAEKKGSAFKCSCSKTSLEEAIETNFICPECQEPYVEFDNSNNIDEIEAEIARIQEFLKAL